MPPSLDPARFTITVADASFECGDGRFTTAISEPDTASGTVAPEDMARSPTDWAAPATVAVGSDVLTTGRVVEALPGANGTVALSLRSALVLSEMMMPPMVCQNLTPSEIVYAAARSAGFAATDMHIDGLDGLPTEPMWVVAPIDGVRVQGAVRIGVVEFLDTATGQEMLRRFAPRLDPQFSEPLGGAAAFARVGVAARLLYDAEEEGLAILDTAAAWLTTRMRYSWSHGPDGQLQRYERAASRVTVERRDGVGVIALAGPRRWWRATTVARTGATVTLHADAAWSDPAMPAAVPAGDRQALLALQRAATAGDPVQRVAALWEAIEFYVGARGPGPEFSAEEVIAIVDHASTGLSDAKAVRVKNVLSQWLNRLSITARLQHALTEDGVPVTADDLALLRRLRDHRNRAVHGAIAIPAHDDVDRALAFMSRAITTRWHRKAAPKH